MLERRYPFESITACTAGAMIVTGAVAAILSTGSASALADNLRESLTLALDNGQKFYKSAGLDTVLQPDMRATIVEGTIKLFPALAALSAAMTVLMNLGLFWRLRGRQERVGYPLFGDLVRWSAPDWLIWALLGTGFGLFIPVKTAEHYRTQLFSLCGSGLFLPRSRDHGILFQGAGDARAGAWPDLLCHQCSAGAGYFGLRGGGARPLDRFSPASAAKPGGA